MKILLERMNNAVHMKATNENGNSFFMDGSSDIGGEGLAMTPMQVLLSSLAGCSSIDVLSILKKMQQEVIDYKVEITGEREKVGDANLFKKINIHFKLRGNLEEAKVRRAINLSLEKYCSVAKTLEATAEIGYSLEILS